MLNDVAVAQLIEFVQSGAKLMQWLLQHFTDRHVYKLRELLRPGTLAHPDPSSIRLAVVTST